MTGAVITSWQMEHIYSSRASELRRRPSLPLVAGRDASGASDAGIRNGDKAPGEAGDDGALWRSITQATSGDTLQEHIYANPSKGEIRYVGLDADGKSEGELEVVHSLVKNKENGSLSIEYFMRNRATRQRVDWTAMHSLDEAENAIETTIALARAKECQIADPNFVGVKA